MLADFTITIDDDRMSRQVQVKVHDDLAALRAAATRYDRAWRKKNPHNQESHSETLGICHRFHMMNQPLCAIVRLAPPHIGAGMIAHEMGHAAVWLWELATQFDRGTSQLNCSNDEWFCWILGELVRQTTVTLIKKGIY